MGAAAAVQEVEQGQGSVKVESVERLREFQRGGEGDEHGGGSSKHDSKLGAAAAAATMLTCRPMA